MMGVESKFERSCSSHQFVVDDLESTNNKASDSSENAQATNIFKWQSTQHEKTMPVSSGFVSPISQASMKMFLM